MPTSNPLITDSVLQAAAWLNSGQLLAYPTESVWGIGCDPFDKVAVEQLLSIKQRPIEKGMIVVTDSAERVKPLLASLDGKQRDIILDSWQPQLTLKTWQAQTWLLPINKTLDIAIPSWITGEHNSVAVRVIAHPLIKQLCAQLVSADNPYGFLVSTSCNPSSLPPAISLEQAQDYFLHAGINLDRQVGYLRGQTLSYELPSQISDAITGQIIR